MASEKQPKLLNFQRNIVHIRKLAEKIGLRYRQIISIYLFGSVARGDADEFSDIDLFILIDGSATNLFLTLNRDVDYKLLEDWALNIVEGGLSPLILNRKELTGEFDTFVGRILQEGIFLFGENLMPLLNKTTHKQKENGSELLDLVRSL